MSVPVHLTIGNRSYKMAVDEGQETRAGKVADLLDSYVEKMHKALGERVDRDQLLVFAALQMADDFYSMIEEKETDEQTLAMFHNTLAERLENLVRS